MIRTLLFVLIFYMNAGISYTQNNLHNYLQEKYGTLNQEQKPGFYIGIIQDGNPIYSRSFGMANIEHQIPFSARTVSDLGSVGKQLTVMGILLLQEEGKLTIGDPIQKFFDESFPLETHVTIKQLIHHTSGIADVYALHSLKGFRYGDHISQSDALKFIEANPTVDFVPGSKYRYSNTGYMLLASIIESVSGSSFESFMRDNIFLPLGMEQTFIMDVPGEVFDDMADSYIPYSPEKYTKMYDNSTLQGGGGVYASGYDVLKWIDNFRTRKVGNDSSFEFLLQNALLNNGDTLNYAGGINVDQYRGIDRYHHNGSSAAARTRLAYYPEHRLGFIIKSNTTSINYSQFSLIEDQIIDQYLNEYASEPRLHEEEDDDVKTADLTPENDNYSGKYYNESLDLTIHVALEGDQLHLNNFYYPFPSLKYQGEDSFKRNVTQVIFHKNDVGEVSKLVLATPRASGLEFIKK